MLNLTAYFDESGTHLTSHVVVLAGLLAPERNWKVLERRWKRVLEKQGVPFFHATDVESVTPRGVYKEWTRRRAEKFSDEMAQIVHDLSADVLGFCMLVDDLDAAFDGRLRSQRPKAAPDVGYNLLAANCFKKVMAMTKGLARGERVSFFFESNDFSASVAAGYETFLRSHSTPERFGTLTIGRKPQFPGLQAADMLAWHVQRAINTEYGFTAGGAHRNFRLVVPHPQNVRTVDRDSLRSHIHTILNSPTPLTR